MLSASHYRVLLLWICVVVLLPINGLVNSTPLATLSQLDNGHAPIASEEPLLEIAPNEFMQLLEEQTRSKLVEYEQVQNAIEGFANADPESEVLLSEVQQDRDFWLNTLETLLRTNEDSTGNNFILNMRVLRDQNEQITLTFDIRTTQEVTVSDTVLPPNSLLFLINSQENETEVEIAAFPQSDNELVVIIPVSTNLNPLGLMVKVVRDNEDDLLNLFLLNRDAGGVIQETPVFTGMVTTSGSNLNVRNGNGVVLQVPGLPNGAIVSILDRKYIDDTWYFNVALPEGQPAYANAQYIHDVTLAANPLSLKTYPIRNQELAAMLVDLSELDALTPYQTALLSTLSERAIQHEQPHPDDPVYFDAYGPLSLRVIMRKFLEEINGFILYKAEDVNGKIWIVAFYGAYYRDGRAFTPGSCPLVDGTPELEGQIVEILAETSGNELPDPTVTIPGSQMIYAVRTECLPEE